VKLTRAISIIERLGIVLVYPMDNRPEPPSLWSEIHDGAAMAWAWDSEADPRVAELWHLRERLARSSDVAYGKWFRGRATFFSLPVFHALLGRLEGAGSLLAGLPHESLDLLDCLRESSPRSTKQLRAEVGLRGKAYEGIFTHAMKSLWSRLLVVGIGETPDGAFPSLSVAATETMFEDIWNARLDVSGDAAGKLDDALTRTPMFAKEVARCLMTVRDGSG
jgi:hypothetical protein